MSFEVLELAAFARGGVGGNPAGVAFPDAFPSDAEMLRVAAKVGHSETAFAVQQPDGAWRVRYFAPEVEVPFCGHATIALGAALGARNGAGSYRLVLNNATIAVEAWRAADAAWGATLMSPSTWSRPAPQRLVHDITAAFGLDEDDLEPGFGPALAHAGATHLVLALRDRQTLARMDYDFGRAKALSIEHGLITINLIWRAPDGVIHARNAFPIGGVLEDPATGAAAAALGGLLRDRGLLDFTKGLATFQIHQGDDMGAPSRIKVEATAQARDGLRVSGAVRDLPAR